MSVEDAFEDSLVSALPEMYQPTGVIDMGAEYFDKELHVTLKAELDRYGIQLDETVSNSVNKCWSFADGTSLSTNDVPIPLHSTAERDEYNRVMDILEFHMQKFRIDQDYRRPRKMFGFTTDELEMLDISFNNYVSNVLKATGTVKEYILSRLLILIHLRTHVPSHLLTYILRGFTFCGGNHTEYSALGFIEDITRLAGLSDTVRDTIKKPFYRIKNGTSSLVEAIAEDLYSTYRTQVEFNTTVASITSLQPPKNLDAPVWRTDLRDPPPVSKLYLSTGEKVLAKAIIVAIPMSCLQTIRFEPSLPHNIEYAASRCQVGRYVKAWIIATGVSKFDNVSTWNNGCIHSHVKYRFDIPNVIVQNKPKGMKGGVAGRLKRKNANMKGAVTLRDSFSTVLSTAECCILEASGLVEDMLDVTKNEQENRYGERVDVDISLLGQHILCEQLQKHLVKHHPTIHVQYVKLHDFYRDVNSRGAGMTVRAGTKHIHKQAGIDAFKPWKSGNNLFFAGADFSDAYTGWVEGAVQSANAISTAAKHYIIPPKKATNLVKKVERVGGNSNDLIVENPVKKQDLEKEVSPSRRRKQGNVTPSSKGRESSQSPSHRNRGNGSPSSRGRGSVSPSSRGKNSPKNRSTVIKSPAYSPTSPLTDIDSPSDHISTVLASTRLK